MSAPTGDFNQFHQEQLEPILRSLEAERQQKTQRFGQITLFSILFGGLFTLISGGVLICPSWAGSLSYRLESRCWSSSSPMGL
jgi:acyl transferase domain-containing protein